MVLSRANEWENWPGYRPYLVKILTKILFFVKIMAN